MKGYATGFVSNLNLGQVQTRAEPDVQQPQAEAYFSATDSDHEARSSADSDGNEVHSAPGGIKSQSKDMELDVDFPTPNIFNYDHGGEFYASASEEDYEVNLGLDCRRVLSGQSGKQDGMSGPGLFGVRMLGERKGNLAFSVGGSNSRRAEVVLEPLEEDRNESNGGTEELPAEAKSLHGQMSEEAGASSSSLGLDGVDVVVRNRALPVPVLSLAIQEKPDESGQAEIFANQEIIEEGAKKWGILQGLRGNVGSENGSQDESLDVPSETDRSVGQVTDISLPTTVLTEAEDKENVNSVASVPRVYLHPEVALEDSPKANQPNDVPFGGPIDQDALTNEAAATVAGAVKTMLNPKMVRLDSVNQEPGVWIADVWGTRREVEELDESIKSALRLEDIDENNYFRRDFTGFKSVAHYYVNLHERLDEVEVDLLASFAGRLGVQHPLVMAMKEVMDATEYEGIGYDPGILVDVSMNLSEEDGPQLAPTQSQADNADEGQTIVLPIPADVEVTPSRPETSESLATALPLVPPVQHGEPPQEPAGEQSSGNRSDSNTDEADIERAVRMTPEMMSMRGDLRGLSWVVRKPSAKGLLGGSASQKALVGSTSEATVTVKKEREKVVPGQSVQSRTSQTPKSPPASPAPEANDMSLESARHSQPYDTRRQHAVRDETHNDRVPSRRFCFCCIG